MHKHYGMIVSLKVKLVWKSRKNSLEFLDHTAKIVVVWFLGLFKIKITDEQWDKFMQFVKFCVVGLSNFIISYVVYAAALALGFIGWQEVFSDL